MMDEATKEALEGSIEKWIANVKAPAPHMAKMGISNCPLCLMFQYRTDGKKQCTGCPVAERSGRRYCFETPYPDADKARDEWQDAVFAQSPNVDDYERAFKAAAQKEVDFLISLREAE